MAPYIDLPKRYLDKESLEKKMDKYEQITGHATFGPVRYSQLMSKSGHPRRWLFWFSHTKYTDVVHVVTNASGEVEKIVQQSAEGMKGFVIYFAKKKFSLEGYVKHKRVSCLCFMFLVPTLTKHTTERGWIIGGSGQVIVRGGRELGANYVLELNNYHLQLELADGDAMLQKNKCVTAHMELASFELLPAALTSLPNELPGATVQRYITGIHHVLNDTQFILEDNRKIEETWIGRHYGAIPRSFFYHDIKRRFRCSPDWLECVLEFGFYLRMIRPGANKIPDFTSKFAMKTLDLVDGFVTKPPWWDDVVSAIIFSICFVVTRFTYQADSEHLSDGSERVFEYFNEHLTMMSGTGDCEDLQWLIHAFLQSVQHLKIEILEERPLLHFVCKILDMYVVTACLVQASRPEFSFDGDNGNSGAYSDNVASEINAENEYSLETSQQFYHETTIIVPKAWFLNHVCKDVIGKLSLQERMKHYSRFRKTMNRERWILEDLHPHIGEGTASVYDQTNKVLSSDPSLPSIIEQRARRGVEPLVMLTNKNCAGGSKMYATIIDMATELFFLFPGNEPSSEIRNTLFLCMEQTSDGKWVEGIQYDYLFNPNLQDKLKICPLGGDMQKLLEETHIHERMQLEFPPVHFHASQNYKSGISGRILREPITWNAGVKLVPVASKRGISGNEDTSVQSGISPYSWIETIGCDAAKDIDYLPIVVID